jgi:type VI secretion system protein ImpA
MPLRDDLLEPIAGDNPSGTNLYHDKLFDQIKEARFEDTDTMPSGDWGRAPKKADHPLVIKLTGDALAKRSKDLRLAGWLVESQFKREGFPVLLPGLRFLFDIQDKFWETLHPEIEEDGNKDLRVVAMESAASRLALALRAAPLTKTGFGLIDYLDSREVGYQADADNNSDRAEARQYAINHGRFTAEDFDDALAATPKAFYAGLEATLESALASVDELDKFQEEKYGDDYPSMRKLQSALEEVKALVSGFLFEKRRLDPDPVADAEPEPEPEVEAVVEPQWTEPAAVYQEPVAAPKAVPAAKGVSGKALTPYEMVVRGAEQLQEAVANSPAPYLVVSGLRLGELRLQPYGGYGIAPGPPSEIRQKLKKMANDGEWGEVLTQSVAMLGEEYARGWLDLHRYIWRAARETGYSELALAVASTLRGVLQDIPELRNWIMDDDTPAANQETQRWIDAEILPPAPEPVAAAEPKPAPVYSQQPQATASDAEAVQPTVFELATQLLKKGRGEEAIAMMVRDANRQANGRSRFQRRVEVAQLCLACSRDDIAYPILSELNDEIERRQLEMWESEDLLVKPMTMLLSCMESRGAPAEVRESLFTRLCRLDPQAALTVRR